MAIQIELNRLHYEKVHDHWLTNKAYLCAITVTNISESFYLQDGDKNQLA